MRWFFDVSKVKEASFLNGQHWPPWDFWSAFFGKYRFQPFQISFFSGFYIKIRLWVRWFSSLFERMKLEIKITMFIHTNQPLITFCIKKYHFFFRINSQASDRKSNPHVSDLPRTAVSVKTLSQGSENFTNVFAGAENHESSLKFEMYIRNSEKMINFFWIF